MRVKFLAFILLCTIPAFGAACDIPFFGNHNKPPKYWLEDGVAKGFLIDMMAYIGKEMGCTFDIQLYPWARAYKKAEIGHGGIIGLSMTEERLRLFDYSDVMYVDELLLVVKKGKEFHFESVSDLKGKTVGVTRGAKYGSAYSEAVEEGVFVVSEDDSQISRFKKLLRERIDVMIVGPGVAGFESILQSAPELLEQREQFVILPVPFKKDPNYMGVPKSLNQGDFIQRFNNALQKGKDSGEIAKIIQSYAE